MEQVFKIQILKYLSLLVIIIKQILFKEKFIE